MTLNNQAAITAFLAGKGLTAAQIAGVEGNLQIESSGRPDASNPREGAIGIAQWEGGRRTALQAFARSTGGTETDLSTQLNFMWQELQTTERGAMTALVAATTPAAAATAFDTKYERSSAASLPARVAAANAIAAGGITGGSGQVDTGSGGTTAAGSTATPAGLDLSSLPFPLNLLGSAANATGGAAAGALAWIGRFLLDAFLVLLGIVLVIVAVKMLASDAGTDHDEHQADEQQQQPQRRQQRRQQPADDDEDQAAAPAPAKRPSLAHREEHDAARVGEDGAGAAAVAA